uniref:Uncharacterized protein n=1 Tax=Arion vulgaris TaxID=1028688 RepID=A0A0B7AQ00_9EUPU
MYIRALDAFNAVQMICIFCLLLISINSNCLSCVMMLIETADFILPSFAGSDKNGQLTAEN